MSQQITDLVDIQIGIQFRQRAEPDPAGEYRVIHIKDFKGGRQLSPKEVDRYAVDGSPEKYQVRKGDILFLAKGVRMFAYVLENEMEKTLAASHFFILRPKTESASQDYLAWALNNWPGQDYLKSVARQGTHIPYVSRKLFEGLALPIPPLDKQRAIVELDRTMLQEEQLLLEFRACRSTQMKLATTKALKPYLMNSNQSKD